jgi:DNA-binding NarL/FixJ family response regulator
VSHTVVIADDSALIRRKIREILEYESDIKVVGEVEDFENAILMARELEPTVLLLDLHMPDDRLLSPEYIKANLPALGSRTYILGISLSSDEDDETLQLGKSLGAIRVLNKGDLYSQLVPTILAIK